MQEAFAYRTFGHFSNKEPAGSIEDSFRDINMGIFRRDRVDLPLSINFFQRNALIIQLNNIIM